MPSGSYGILTELFALVFKSQTYPTNFLLGLLWGLNWSMKTHPRAFDSHKLKNYVRRAVWFPENINIPNGFGGCESGEMSQPEKGDMWTATSFRARRLQVAGNNLAICPPLPAGQSGKVSRGEVLRPNCGQTFSCYNILVTPALENSMLD